MLSEWICIAVLIAVLMTAPPCLALFVFFGCHLRGKSAYAEDTERLRVKAGA